mmetsp:Transcript_7298/g.20587  ORF Transcript_7298/g.20587 Transcript_7298/m.20587 type:complete len:270 (-) Transcript_7298:117-926(-)
MAPSSTSCRPTRTSSQCSRTGLCTATPPLPRPLSTRCLPRSSPCPPPPAPPCQSLARSVCPRLQEGVPCSPWARRPLPSWRPWQLSSSLRCQAAPLSTSQAHRRPSTHPPHPPPPPLPLRHHQRVALESPQAAPPSRSREEPMATQRVAAALAAAAAAAAMGTAATGRPRGRTAHPVSAAAAAGLAGDTVAQGKVARRAPLPQSRRDRLRHTRTTQYNIAWEGGGGRGLSILLSTTLWWFPPLNRTKGNGQDSPQAQILAFFTPLPAPR